MVTPSSPKCWNSAFNAQGSRGIIVAVTGPMTKLRVLVHSFPDFTDYSIFYFIFLIIPPLFLFRFGTHVLNNYFIFLKFSLWHFFNKKLWSFGNMYCLLLSQVLLILNLEHNEIFYNIFYCFFNAKMRRHNVPPNYRI